MADVLSDSSKARLEAVAGSARPVTDPPARKRAGRWRTRSRFGAASWRHPLAVASLVVSGAVVELALFVLAGIIALGLHAQHFRTGASGPDGFLPLLDSPLSTAVAVVGVSVILVGASRHAVRYGIRVGQARERTRIARSLHDTVLQALEAMALDAGLDRRETSAALAELRTIARAEATRLRGLVDELSGAAPGALDDALGAAVTEAQAHGLRVRLSVADTSRCRLSSKQVEAVVGATREALTNIAKHSGASEAWVRADLVDHGIQVIVRDQGRGFALLVGGPGESTVQEGFGIRESILARLREAGGTAGVESWPGRGTRVRLWIPL